MNERIKELEAQCWEPRKHPASQAAMGDKFNTEKFAELIVQKLDDILVLEYLDCVGNKDKRAEKRVQRLREKVKTYFGVEE